MRNIVCLALLLFAVGASFGGEKLITNVDHRKTKNLEGQWHIIIDPFESGFYDLKGLEKSTGYFRDSKPRSISSLIEYNFDQNETLMVPGDWNSQKEKLFFYEGTVWYKRSFNYPLKKNKRLFVYFGAANYESVVYLNGKKLGSHIGGFTPFQFEITDRVKNTGNVLVVKVDNKRKKNAVPTVMSDWWNYGGITRRVLLIEEEKEFVRDYSIQLKKGSTKTLAGWIQLDGQKPVQTVTVEIPEASLSEKVQIDNKGYGAFEFDADLSLWSPDNPKLYKVIIKSRNNVIEDEIGFRSIEVQGDRILLNGKSIFLRGICIHEEAPMREGRAYSKDDAKLLFEWAQDMNCNFVRLAHYPHNEHMTRLADKLGILVWSEIPLYWTIQWENKEVYQNAIQQLEEMIARDKNKASIIMWSVANETPISELRTAFLAKLIKHTRALDPTRLITAAIKAQNSDSTILINDPLGEHLDVLGCNEYTGWYGSNKPEKFFRTWKSIYDKPLVMSEFGAGALQGYHGDQEKRWTEEFQQKVYKRQIPMLEKIPFLRGSSPWILKDFRSPRRPLPHIQDYYNRKGLISERGVRKKAFYVMQDFYEKKMKE